MRFAPWWLIVTCLLPGGFTAAQNSTIPQTCAGKSGEALHICVRDFVPSQQTEQITPAPISPRPAQLFNCLQVLPADQSFCIGRNEIILECRNKTKHPDFDKCFAGYIGNVPVPTAANCARSGKKLRAQCTHRNEVYKQCVVDPLRYFTCLADNKKPDMQR